MRLYGFTPQILFHLVSRPTATPQIFNNKTNVFDYDYNYNTKYVYDSTADNLGCDALLTPCEMKYIQKSAFPSWLSTINSAVDLRGIYSTCSNTTDSYYVPVITNWPSDVLDTQSHISGTFVRYTT